MTDAVNSEHNLPYNPVSINILQEDSMCFNILQDNKSACFNGFRCSLFKIYNSDFTGTEAEGKKNLEDFLKNFYDIENDINEYFYFNKLQNITWMAEEILERTPENS